MPIAALSPSTSDASGRGYPRPQLQRKTWYSLNGQWDFALDPDGRWCDGSEVHWSERINVPFAPEAPLSGIGFNGFFRACWYRKRFELPPQEANERWLLHFGAIDTNATVWVDGSYVGRHDGGYTPFSFDITPFTRDGVCEIVVRAED